MEGEVSPLNLRVPIGDQDVVIDYPQKVKQSQQSDCEVASHAIGRPVLAYAHGLQQMW